MRVRWDGPSGFVNRDVGAATGEGDVLEHGSIYDVDDELGEQLIRYDANWHHAEGDELKELLALQRPELDEAAKKAGIEEPGRYPNKRALAKAIAEAGAAVEA